MCSPWIGDNATLCLQKLPGAQRRRTAAEKTGLHSAQTARSCQLPPERRRSNSRASLRIVSGLAENTDAIFCDDPQGSETANGCPVLRRQEPPPRGTGASCGFWQVRRARSSEARVRRTVFSLDKDLHGCPVLRRQEPPPTGTGASCGFWQGRLARSSAARVRRTVFSLDKDLHGYRLAGRDCSRPDL